MKVFLGGTCNGSTWREEMIGYLESAGIDYFNPVVKDWDDEARKREIQERELCDFCVYTITPKMIGNYAVAEVVDDGHKRPSKTIMILLRKDDDFEFTDKQWDSLHAVALLVGKYGVKCFYDLKSAVDFIVSKDAAAQVEVRFPDGTISWYVRKREVIKDK